MDEGTGTDPEQMGLEPLPPGIEARATRRLGIMLGLVLLPEMTQGEVDWVFEQKRRMGVDD